MQEVVTDSLGEEQLEQLSKQLVQAQEQRRQSLTCEVFSAREVDLREQIERLRLMFRTKQSQWVDALPDEAGMVEAARKIQDGPENAQEQCGEPKLPSQEEILHCLPPGVTEIEGQEPRAAAAAMVRQQEDCQVAYGTIPQVLNAWTDGNTD